MKQLFNLTQPQKRIWIVENIVPETPIGNIGGIFTIHKKLNLNILKKAINLVVNDDKGFLLNIIPTENELKQYILDSSFEDEISCSFFEDEKKLMQWINQDFTKNINLYNDKLYKIEVINLANEKTLVYLKMHHIISDGWSCNIIFKKIGEYYDDLINNQLIERKTNYSYLDYINKENEYLVSERFNKDKKYWLDKFSDIDSHDKLFDSSGNYSFKGCRDNLYFSKEENKLIREMCEKYNWSLNTFFMSILFTYIYRYLSKVNITIGTGILNRSGKKEKDIVGMFISTIPFKFKIDDNIDFLTFIESINREILKDFRHQRFPYNLLTEELNKKNKGKFSNLYDVIFTYLNINSDYIVDGAKTEIDDCYSGYQFEPLRILVKEFDFSDISLSFDYNINLFTIEEIKKMQRDFKTIINQIIESPNMYLKDIEILSTKEKEKIIKEFNNTKTNYPQEKTTVEIFEEQVKKNPQNIAVECKNEQLTYQELNERSNQMAHFLRKKGVKPSESIGLIVERSIDTIVGILGILKAGASYLPLEADYPIDRIQFMLEDSETQIILGHSSFKEKIPEGKAFIEMERLNLKDEEGNNLTHVNMPTDTIYTIYTSGSTGNPKGSIIQHKSVIRLVKNTNYIDIQKEDKILQLSNYAFDGSVFDIFGALLNGATLVLISKEELLSMEILGEIIEEKGISIFFITTALFNSLIDLNLSCLKNVRKILFGGERVSLKHIQKAFDTYGPGKLVHVYGPTENTVFTTYKEINELSTNLNTVPIGKPIANTSVYILDENNKIVPIGVPGELCISGDGLSKGYLNHQELTKKSFIENPYEQGTKLYKTGDRVKWLPNGDVVFLERKDAQVKIRGFRIELEEIEQEIIKYPKVREAIVNITEPSILSAYYVSDEQLNSKEIKEYLKKKIPEFMIPTNIVAIDRMPLNINGKVDKSLLPKITVEEVKEEYIPPRNEMEKNMSDIFCDILGQRKIGIHSDFYELGIDSIKAIQIVSKLKAIGVNVTVKMILNHPTICELVKYCSNTNNDISQEVVTGDVIMTPIQRWLFEKNLQNTKQFNQSIMLFRSEGFIEEIVASVFSEIIRHHDSLRMSFVNRNNKVCQYNKGIKEDFNEISIVDCFDCKSIDDLFLRKKELFNESFDLENGPLVKIKIFRTEKGDYLLVTIHHLVVDGVSWRIILEDFSKGYKDHLNGTCTKFQEKTNSYKEWASLLAENSSTLKYELDYWNNVISSARDIVPLISSHEKKGTYHDVKRMNLCLPPFKTKELKFNSTKYLDMNLNEILLSALGKAFHDLIGGKSFLINLESHGREEIFEQIDISRTVGWFTTIYPVSIYSNDFSNTELTLRSIKETIRGIPKNGIGYGRLKYLLNTSALLTTPKEMINFNYLGELNNSDEIFSIHQVPSEHYISKDNCALYLIDINCILIDSRLNIEFAYDVKNIKENIIQKIVNSFANALDEIISFANYKKENQGNKYDLQIDEIENIYEAIELVSLEVNNVKK